MTYKSDSREAVFQDFRGFLLCHVVAIFDVNLMDDVTVKLGVLKSATVLIRDRPAEVLLPFGEGRGFAFLNMATSRSALQRTISILRERGAKFKQEDIQSLFEDPESGEDATRWVEDCLGETTLLTKEEATL